MPNLLGSLTVDLVANTGKFNAGMSDAARAAMRTSKQIHESFSRLGTVAQDALAPLGNLGAEISMTLGNIGQAASGALAKFKEMSSATRIVAGVAAGTAVAAGAIGVGLFEAANKAAEFGSKIFEASEKTGMSASNLSGLAAVCKATGEDFDNLTDALSRAGRNLKQALIDPSEITSKVLASMMGGAKNLAALGMIPLDDAMQKVMARIFALNDVGARNLALNALVGRGWMTNVETLKMLAEQGYGPAIAQAQKFGMYFNDDAARQAKEYTVEMTEMKAQLAGLGLTIGQSVLPVMNRLMVMFVGLGQSAAGFADEVRAVMLGLVGDVGGAGAAWTAYKQHAQAALQAQTDFLTHTQSLIEGEKSAADAGNSLAISTGRVGKAHHEAAKGVRELDSAFKIIIPHIKTMDDMLQDLAASRWDEKMRAVAQTLSTLQHGELPKIVVGPMPDLSPQMLDPFGGMAASIQKSLAASVPPLNTFHDEVVKFFTDLQAQGADLGSKVFDSLGKTINDLSGQIAHLAVTGKSSFRQMATGLAESTMKTGIQGAFGQIGSKAAGALGIKLPGARGDSLQNPLYVQDVSAKRGLIPGVSGGQTSSQAGGGGGGGAGTGGSGQGGGGVSRSLSLAGSLFSKILKSKSDNDDGDGGNGGDDDGSDGSDGGDGGGGGFFGSILGAFKGLASGGAVTPGKAYVVGERHPEFFVPRQPGHVAPSLSLGGQHQTVMNFNVNGVQDADSFRHSQGQIMSMMQNQMAIANARNQ